MVTRIPFALNEWYHCFNRGIDKRIVFEERSDYERFLQLLYLCNSDHRMHRSDLLSHTTEEIVAIPRGNPLVGIGAFCLMTNHIHLLLQEKTEGGISLFMQKLGTAYTMYFNKKNQRTGNLFMRPFRSRHVGQDEYFQQLVHYIHCNPAELYERSWKKGLVKNLAALEKGLLSYRYSSLGAYEQKNHVLHSILDAGVFQIAHRESVAKMVHDAHAYYAETAREPMSR